MEEFSEIAPTIIIILGWFLVALGAIKMVFWLVGEFLPSAWSKIKSPSIRDFLTGTGNRIIFGGGGLLTVVLGLAAVAIGKMLIRMNGGG